jgi:hypothetical protein
MGTPEESVKQGNPAVKPDRSRKHKGGIMKAAKVADSQMFCRRA